MAGGSETVKVLVSRMLLLCHTWCDGVKGMPRLARLRYAELRARPAAVIHGKLNLE